MSFDESGESWTMIQSSLDGLAVVEEIAAVFWQIVAVMVSM